MLYGDLIWVTIRNQPSEEFDIELETLLNKFDINKVDWDIYLEDQGCFFDVRIRLEHEEDKETVKSELKILLDDWEYQYVFKF